MFNDLFDFSKKRSLKESVGFFIFHGALASVAVALIKFLEMGSL